MVDDEGSSSEEEVMPGVASRKCVLNLEVRSHEKATDLEASLFEIVSGDDALPQGTTFMGAPS